ncbi:MAG TPA: protein phosphatase 2C domain-containing protein [Nocardioides sp.]|nr:protein phosphatase 2C domain-containing protein [Nocardioides sp.]
MNQVELNHGAATDVGRVREVNEDAFLVDPPVFVVADGMGGHDGGDVASAIVVEEFAAFPDGDYDPPRGAEAVAATLRACQARISGYGAEQRARGAAGFHSGTTAVVALVVEDDGGPQWLLANLGDSRIYRYADGVLDQVSVDHSLVQELVRAGRITQEAAATHPERHIITRSLGGPDGVEADYFLLPLAEVERLVLCSDGVTGMIGDDRIAEILGRVTDPGEAAGELVAAAVAAGGRDNATAVVVDAVGRARPDSDTLQMNLDEQPGARQ